MLARPRLQARTASGSPSHRKIGEASSVSSSGAGNSSPLGAEVGDYLLQAVALLGVRQIAPDPDESTGRLTVRKDNALAVEADPELTDDRWHPTSEFFEPRK